MNNDILDAAEPSIIRDEAHINKLRRRGRLFALTSAAFWLPLQYTLYAYSLLNFTEATGWETSTARLFFISLLCLGGLAFLASALYFAIYNYTDAKSSTYTPQNRQLIYFLAAITLTCVSYMFFEMVSATDIFQPLGFQRGNNTHEFGFILLCICCAIAAALLVSMFASIFGYRAGQISRERTTPL